MTVLQDERMLFEGGQEQQQAAVGVERCGVLGEPGLVCRGPWLAVHVDVVLASNSVISVQCGGPPTLYI